MTGSYRLTKNSSKFNKTCKKSDKNYKCVFNDNLNLFYNPPEIGSSSS